MILFAAIVPPESVLGAVEDALRQQVEPLGVRPLNDATLPIARFGNTSSEDADRLTRVLTTAADNWRAMRLSLGGASVLEMHNERILGFVVRGDVNALVQLSLGVKQAAEPLRFILDRRDFSPVLPLASVGPSGSSSIDTAAAALGDFESESWLVTEVSMRKQTYGHQGASEELARIALRPG